MANSILDNNIDQVIRSLSQAKAVVSLLGAFDPSEHERESLQDAAWAARDLIDQALAQLTDSPAAA